MHLISVTNTGVPSDVRKAELEERKRESERGSMHCISRWVYIKKIQKHKSFSEVEYSINYSVIYSPTYTGFQERLVTPAVGREWQLYIKLNNVTLILTTGRAGSFIQESGDGGSRGS